MLWTVNSKSTSDVVKYLDDMRSSIGADNKPKYVLSWNEPDMIGTILPASATGQADTGASSAGFWNGTALKYFVYGNASDGDLTKIQENHFKFFTPIFNHHHLLNIYYIFLIIHHFYL